MANWTRGRKQRVDSRSWVFLATEVQDKVKGWKRKTSRPQTKAGSSQVTVQVHHSERLKP
jgi:hypothetical protein